MNKFIVILFLSTMHLMAGVIQIAVAANVSYAIDALREEFHKNNPDTKVIVILGSSGKLTAQISHGAPYGLFMSANMKYPEALYAQNIAMTKPVVYAQGALALFSVKKRDFSVGMELLKDPSIKKIALGNPKTAPYGKAALQAIKNAKLYEAVKSKLIFGESISQTLSYAIYGADIGIVAKSALLSSKMAQYKEDENFYELDATLYTPIKQGIVLLKSATNTQEYKAFYDFILSQKAKKIFLAYGYSF